MEAVTRTKTVRLGHLEVRMSFKKQGNQWEELVCKGKNKFAFEMFEFKIHLVNKIHMNKHMKT